MEIIASSCRRAITSWTFNAVLEGAFAQHRNPLRWCRVKPSASIWMLTRAFDNQHLGSAIVQSSQKPAGGNFRSCRLVGLSPHYSLPQIDSKRGRSPCEFFRCGNIGGALLQQVSEEICAHSRL